MRTAASAFDAHGWTSERLQRLNRDELANLQANAERLGEPALAALCSDLLKERPRRGPSAAGTLAPTKARRGLVARSRAFEARGVWLQDPRTSWSGVRKSDGKVVMALWHAAVKSHEGGCACLLWAPNVDGARAWSDTAAGRERLEHCKLAMAGEGAEGLFVYGQLLDGKLPEERARTILGIDPQTVVQFKVELRAGEYWAVWGKKTPRA
ncbi:MAG: hypothetical protein ABR570_06580 [Burkholderiales bacterium]